MGGWTDVWTDTQMKRKTDERAYHLVYYHGRQVFEYHIEICYWLRYFLYLMLSLFYSCCILLDYLHMFAGKTLQWEQWNTIAQNTTFTDIFVMSGQLTLSYKSISSKPWLSSSVVLVDVEKSCDALSSRLFISEMDWIKSFGIQTQLTSDYHGSICLCVCQYLKTTSTIDTTWL